MDFSFLSSIPPLLTIGFLRSDDSLWDKVRYEVHQYFGNRLFKLQGTLDIVGRKLV